MQREKARRARTRLRRRCEESLADFIAEGWRVLEPTTPLLWNWHINAIADHVQAVLEDWMRRQKDDDFVQRIQNLLINVPPGTAKSRIVSVMAPAWMWARWPSWKAIFLSANPRVALRDSVYSRDVITSQWYRETFTPDWELKDDQDAKGLFANTKGGFRQSQGITAKITGDRADAIFVDDPHDAEEVHSDAKRTEVTERWDTAIANRVNDLRTSVRIGIMQRLHELDWSGHVLKGGGWEHLCLPMEYEPARARTTAIGWSDPRTVEGEVLHPVRFPPAVLAAEKKRLGPHGTAGQLQQRPTPAEGAIFQRGWFLRWTRGDLPPKFDELICSWDFTFKDTKDSDYVVGGVIARCGARKYLLERVRDRMDLVRTCAEVEALREGAMARWASRLPRGYTPTVLYEDKANGPAVKSTLREKVPGLVPFDPGDRSKEARAYAVTPTVHAGDFFVPADAPWVEEYVAELTSFPKGANDDQVDMTTQALLHLQSTSETWVPKPPEPPAETTLAKYGVPSWADGTGM